MKRKRLLAALLVTLASLPAGRAQGGLPTGGEPLLEVPAITPALLLARDKAQSLSPDKAWQFAEPQVVRASRDAYGQWEDAGGGRWIWRLLVYAPGATDVNIGFTDLLLPEGCTMRVLAAEGQYGAGPYTSADLGETRQLWTAVLPGELVTIEAEMPAAAADRFALTIGQVSSGYRDVFRRGFPGRDKQGTCNVDVICPSADPWRNEIRSVARYTISGAYLCTGSLVMNQRADFRAYFLTAAHCLDTAAEASSVVVYWNYQSPTCGTLSGGSLSQSQSGASLRATYANSDFTLLELNSIPSAGRNVYYAGWDCSGIAPAASVCIHHPAGDEKSISFYDAAVQSTSYGGTTVSAGANHWRVVDWNTGTTEGGSSGSGLWSVAGHRIFGHLHGGGAACGNNSSDWYGKVSTDWAGGGTAATRLRDWLDPDSTGLQGMNGADPATTTTSTTTTSSTTSSSTSSTSTTTSTSTSSTTAPPPRLQAWSMSNGTVALSATALQVGRTVTVLRSTTLVGATWKTGGQFVATSTTTNWSDTTALSNAFYRLRL